MASRILHLAVAEEVIKKINIQDRNRFRIGCVLPDARAFGVHKDVSHLCKMVCGNSKKTYDSKSFFDRFEIEIKTDELYLGYYLHLVQDLVFREIIYDKYKWNPTIPGNVQRLYNDYHRINAYAISKYGIKNDLKAIENIESEKLSTLCSFEPEAFLADMENDFEDNCVGSAFFLTEAMADEFIEAATEVCIRELQAIAEGGHYVDEYDYAWLKTPVSLLNTTQNTRDLGGYRTKSGKLTKERVLLRSDVQNFPSEEDIQYLKDCKITTVIDVRGQRDVEKKPSGFVNREGFNYYNFQIDEGSGVPESVDEVSASYMRIAKAKAMPHVFRCIANAPDGVMFNCTAGKDRTGVISAILLLHVGAKDEDIIENYVLTKEYAKERLELVHKNFPELDMNIVTPCERYMKEFLELFREEYGDTNTYFTSLGLTDKEIGAIRGKLLDEEL